MISSFGMTNVGRVRNNNEDRFLSREIGHGMTLMLVSDGVGGAAFGEVASQTVVDVFNELIDSGKLAPATDISLRPGLIKAAVHRAHSAILQKGEGDSTLRGMACTVTVVIVDDKRVDFAQVGDSRLYHYRQGEFVQLTTDQTLAREMFEDGRINKNALDTHPQRHTLSQALGIDHIHESMTPVLGHCDWQENDRLVLCSDGLTDMVKDDDLANIIAQPNSLPETAKVLIQAALDNGGKDNVTVVLVENTHETVQRHLNIPLLVDQYRWHILLSIIMLVLIVTAAFLYWGPKQSEPPHAIAPPVVTEPTDVRVPVQEKKSAEIDVNDGAFYVDPLASGDKGHMLTDKQGVDR